MSVTTMDAPRQNKRVSLSSSAVVKVKENKDSFWKETTELVSVSRSGAGFYLKKKCEVGRLVSLMLSIPKHLRCYDTEKELYRAWGLVQHCSPVFNGNDESFHVGVAFTGKNAPASYDGNPLQSYRVTGINEDGTWRIVEAKKDFIVRRFPRFQVGLEILLSAMDSKNTLITDEAAKTENISMSGAAVFSTLDIYTGDSVTFNSVQHNFSALSIVRNRKESEFEPPRLHLEFINAKFPIGEIVLPGAAQPEANENEFFYQ